MNSSSGLWRDMLPTTLEVGGEEYAIRPDYRAALVILLAFSDPELDDYNKAMEAIDILYVDAEKIPPEHMQEALEKCRWFIDGGTQRQASGPKLVDWAQDFPLIVAPINRVMGQEIRAAEYLHWWTFLSAYMEIGDCLFAQVARIRDMQARGKAMDKADREFYRRNRDIIDIKQKYTKAEEEIFSEWM